MKNPSMSNPCAKVQHSQKLATSLIAMFVGLVGLTAHTTSHAIEEPEYTVVRQLEGIEVSSISGETRLSRSGHQP